MAGLPFVVQPRFEPIIERIGTQDSGQVEIERRGYLATGEKAFVQQVQQQEDGSGEIVTLSRQVARKYGISMDRAYSIILVIISGEQLKDEKDQALSEKIELEFAQGLTAIVKGLAVIQSREELVLAACMIKYRIDPDFDISSISSIHPDLISALANFYRQEESKSLEAFLANRKEEKVSVEESEKKHETGPKSRSKSTTTD